MHDLHRAPTQNIARAHDQRVADLGREAGGFDLGACRPVGGLA